MSEGVATIGTCLHVSADLPATHDKAGFEALTYAHSSEVTNFGEFGPSNEVITYNTVCNGTVNKRMGATNYGQQSLEMAFVHDNGVQEILEDVADSKKPISVRLDLSTGGKAYYKAYVASFKTVPGGSSDYLRGSATLEIDGTVVVDKPA